MMRNQTPRRRLVTGGPGFIGSYFVRQLVADDARVINLNRVTYADNLDSRAEVANCENHVFEQGEIGDFAFVTRLLDTHRPAAIANFAARSHVDRSFDGPCDFMQTNVVGRLGKQSNLP